MNAIWQFGLVFGMVVVGWLFALLEQRHHREWLAAWNASDGQGWRVLGRFPYLVIRTETVELRFVRIAEGKGTHWESRYESLAPTTLAIVPNSMWPLAGARFDTAAQGATRLAIETAYAAGLSVEASNSLLFGTAHGLDTPAEAKMMIELLDRIVAAASHDGARPLSSSLRTERARS